MIRIEFMINDIAWPCMPDDKAQIWYPFEMCL